jgi:hypothetical protein
MLASLILDAILSIPAEQGNKPVSVACTDLNELDGLREMEDQVAREKGIDAETLRRMVAKVEEYSETHRAHGLPDDLLNILKDDLESQATRAPR